MDLYTLSAISQLHDKSGNVRLFAQLCTLGSQYVDTVKRDDYQFGLPFLLTKLLCTTSTLKRYFPLH